MKNIIFVAALLAGHSIVAQNVGIGTIAPTSKLTIAGTETTFNGESAAIKIQNLAAPASNAWYLRAGATGTGAPIGGFSIADNIDYRFNITSAGSIGIGTTTPTEQLTLQSGNVSLLSSTKGILLNGFDGPMINRGFDPFTTGNYTGLGRWGLFMEPNNLTIGLPAAPFKAFAISSYNNNSSVNKQLFRVSLDAAATNALVEVNGTMKIESQNTLEFGAGIVGKELNAGKIGYNSFGFDGLSIVGSGTTALNRKVNVFAEGGTTFNGPINVGGSSGTSGQILTSNGTVAPGWQTLSTPYGNTTRFAVSYTQGLIEIGDANHFLTRYNLDPANITVASTGVTLNRGGLYHFDVFVKSSYAFVAPPAFVPIFGLWLFNGLPDPFPIVDGAIMTSTANNTVGSRFQFTGKYSIDIYVAAGKKVKLYHTFFGITTFGGGDVSGYLAGYLINP